MACPATFAVCERSVSDASRAVRPARRTHWAQRLQVEPWQQLSPLIQRSRVHCRAVRLPFALSAWLLLEHMQIPALVGAWHLMALQLGYSLVTAQHSPAPAFPPDRSGSWNRVNPIGYRIQMLQVNHNTRRALGQTTFLEGWLDRRTGNSWGVHPRQRQRTHAHCTAGATELHTTSLSWHRVRHSNVSHHTAGDPG